MAAIRNQLHFEIIPGILEQEWESIEKKIEQTLTLTESIHIDLLDGKFAPNTTFFDPAPFKKYSKDVILEVHMMVDNPVQYLQAWADAGFQRFLGHMEMMPDVAEFVAQAELLGEVGLALDIPTPAEKLFPFIEDIDVAFVMTVKAGFSHQQFDPTMLEKIGELRARDPLLAIEVDGGVNEQDITVLKDAGATRFVSTGFLFNGENPEEQYSKLKKLL